MPPRRDVATLQTLSVRGVGAFLVHLAPKICADIQGDPGNMARNLDRHVRTLRDHVTAHVASHLYDRVAVEVLAAVKRQIDRQSRGYYLKLSMTQYLTEMNVLLGLIEVVLSEKLRCVDFSQWPRTVRHVLHANLPRMHGLEVLKIGSCASDWRSLKIVEGVANVRNLRLFSLCFDCTDRIVQAVTECCVNIQFIDVTSSRSVTDRSVPFLLKSNQLEELNLHHTSVSRSGLVELLARLPRLQSLGRCDELPHLLTVLPAVTYPRFSRANTRDLTADSLSVLVRRFPRLETLALLSDLHCPALTALARLPRLRQLKLARASWFAHSLPQLLDCAGAQLLNLHLEHSELLPFECLALIGARCPNLSSFVVYNCDFAPPVAPLSPLTVDSFAHLTRLFWVVDNSAALLELILARARSIQHVHLGSSTGIKHSNWVGILRDNSLASLRELRVLYSSDMSMRTVELLLGRCGSLRVLSELEGWEGISSHELRDFRDFLRRNNFDLDVSATLSLNSYLG